VLPASVPVIVPVVMHVACSTVIGPDSESPDWVNAISNVLVRPL
jgi:hypothetical protein